MRYEYRVVPAPSKGEKAKGLKTPTDRYAHALAKLMNELGADGWDYVRADTLPSEERKGLTGRVTVYHTLLVFRRAVGLPVAAPLAAAPLAAPPLAAAPLAEAPERAPRPAASVAPDVAAPVPVPAPVPAAPRALAADAAPAAPRLSATPLPSWLSRKREATPQLSAPQAGADRTD